MVMVLNTAPFERQHFMSRKQCRTRPVDSRRWLWYV